MKRTLITCANSGIGAEIARRVSGNDKLLLASRDLNKLAKLAANLEASSELYQLDFFDSASVEQCTSQIIQQGKVDNLVLILPRVAPSNKVFPSEQDWLKLFNNYFVKPLSLLKGLVEREALNNGAKVVLISGLSTKSAMSHYAMNNCLRNAWLGQAKTMALALGEKGISVNTLSLGGVMTKAYTDKLKGKAEQAGVPFEELMQDEVSNIPLKKYASVEEVADAVLSLLGPLANHMTGQNILLDGGFFKGY
ncbi:SDR family oxidoreductase [Vibrio marisflavi]|uniref:3-oxoacyl-[acyl-carrier-protein] reductase FabG n=1 Tax=Vibrio marisflavi CECT 7928 TaxID=634439 RepID=A0ABN8E243_9VIBR|nr:SDR family oxidoreductase [Vibrio marisflavi]CAH0537061.1 3-oxoacyl-[acyl-carrier-protein] reductase FabG [Vibrio marisflavi CECT 7928]